MAGRIRSIEKSADLIGNRTRDHPTCYVCGVAVKSLALSVSSIFITQSGTEDMAVGIRQADQVAPLYPQKLALTSPTSGGRSVGIVLSRTQAMEFFLTLLSHQSLICVCLK
jgi:hypothetical protein